MKIIRIGETLTVSELEALDGAHCPALRSAVEAALEPAVTGIDVDLSATRFADCSGLGGLIALLKSARARKGRPNVRLLHPTPSVERLVQLTNLHEVFEVDGAYREAA